MNPNVRRIVQLGGIVVVVALVGGYYWYITMKQNQMLAEVGKEYEVAEHLHHDGDVDASIAAFQKILEYENLPETIIMRSKIRMIFDMFSRNEGDDRARAIQMYKEIITDESISKYYRAISINELLDLYNATHDEHVLEAIIQGEPFGKYLTAEEGNPWGSINTAARKVYEYSYSLYPTPIAALRVATWYRVTLTDGVDSLRKYSDGNFEELYAKGIENLKHWTTEGEKNVYQAAADRYEKSKIAYIYQLLAQAKWAIAELTDKDFTEAEKTYHEGLALLADSSELHTYDTAAYFRFHYASDIARDFGQKRIADIKEVLKPVYDRPAEFVGKHLFFDEFLKSETGHEHDSHSHKEDLTRLSRLVPEFSRFLTSKGISY